MTNDERIRELKRLTAQVIIHERQNNFEANLNALTTTVDRLGQRVDKLAVDMDAFWQSHKEQGERIDKLVIAIGELIQRLPAK